MNRYKLFIVSILSIMPPAMQGAAASIANEPHAKKDGYKRVSQDDCNLQDIVHVAFPLRTSSMPDIKHRSGININPKTSDYHAWLVYSNKGGDIETVHDFFTSHTPAKNEYLYTFMKKTFEHLTSRLHASKSIQANALKMHIIFISTYNSFYSNAECLTNCSFSNNGIDKCLPKDVGYCHSYASTKDYKEVATAKMHIEDKKFDKAAEEYFNEVPKARALIMLDMQKVQTIREQYKAARKTSCCPIL